MKKIFYYEIAVACPSLKETGVFTYCSEVILAEGAVVEVSLKKKIFSGVVVRTTKKPQFSIKTILNITELKVPPKQLKLMLWSLDFYPGESGSLIKLFLPPNLIKHANPSNYERTRVIKKPDEPLTNEQSKAIRTINQGEGVFLLHGSTGSGKTRVYVELAIKVIKSKRSVLILSPEIGLAEQMQSTLDNYFSGCISYHSLHTIKHRREKWLALAQDDNPQIIIGPRSALFLPVKNIGLIIIDEAHDSAYKQLQSPYYSTVQLATKLALTSKAKLIYGSATPNTTDYYSAVMKGYPVIKMTERPVASKTKNKLVIKVIDSSDKTNFSRNRFISTEAIELIRSSCQKGMQSLVLLNRRGTAQLLQCDTCIWQYRCPACDHTLVYHRDKHKALCHYCGRQCPMLIVCPEDQGKIKQLSIGTKYIEETCKSLFPSENIQRIDRDSVERETIKDTMLSLSEGKANILVGTQLLAKGLDLPLLSTIVVLDASPKSSDFLGDERYYQLIHQVIGRGIRGHQNTNIIIQTPNKDDQIIKWATEDNWQEFYKYELSERSKYHYPPYVQLAVIRFTRKNSESADIVYKKITKNSAELKLRVEILGPLPVRTNNKNTHGWVILIKAKKRADLIKATKHAPGDASVELDPIATQ